MNGILDDWNDIHKNTRHGLVLCYNVKKVNIIVLINIFLVIHIFIYLVINNVSVMRVLPIALEIERDTFLLVIVHCMTGPLGPFIDDIIFLINELPAQHSLLVVGDFNFSKILSEHVAKIDPLIQNFNLSQHSQFSTHIYGAISDMVFDTSNQNIISSLPSPYSDRFVIFFCKSDTLYLYRI